MDVNGPPFNGLRRFDNRCYLHKMHSFELRYEMAMNVLIGDIVWISGSIPCGVNLDVYIYRMSLRKQLLDNKNSCYG